MTTADADEIAQLLFHTTPTEVRSHLSQQWGTMHDWVQIYCVPFLGDQVVMLYKETTATESGLGLQLPSLLIRFPPREADPAQGFPLETGHDMKLGLLAAHLMSEYLGGVQPNMYCVASICCQSLEYDTSGARKVAFIARCEVLPGSVVRVIERLPESERRRDRAEIEGRDVDFFAWHDVKWVALKAFEMREVERRGRQS